MAEVQTEKKSTGKKKTAKRSTPKRSKVAGELVTERIPFELNDGERVKLGQRIAQLHHEIVLDTEEFKETKKVLQGKINEKQKEVAELADTLREGQIWREVECHREITDEVVRFKKSGKTVYERPATDNDRQLRMHFASKGANKLQASA